MKTIKIAAIQFNSKPDKAKNYHDIMVLAKKIRRNSVSLITLPEVFHYCGTEDGDLNSAENYKSHSAISFLRELAQEKNAYIAGGSVNVKVPGSKKVRNRTVFLDPKGKILSFYDKIHLFDVDFKNGRSFKESNYIEPGDKLKVTNTPFGKVGFTICYDLRFPELFRKLALKGAEIIVVPAAFLSKTGQYHWETLLRARAIENQVFIVATGQVGSHSPSRHTYGGSVIIDPWGNVLARAKTNTKDRMTKSKGEIITATLDAKILESVRRDMPCLKHTKLI